MAGRWISRCAKTAGSLAGSQFNLNCHQCAYQAAQERCKQRRREPQNLCGCSHGIASHQPGIVRLQQIGRRIHGPFMPGSSQSSQLVMTVAAVSLWQPLPQVSAKCGERC